MFPKKIVLVGFFLYLGCFSLGDLNRTSSLTGLHRQHRLFSLFNIVRFENDPCTSNSDVGVIGTCFSAQECTTLGGAADGNCASGFGVCCIFSFTGCSGTVNRNCTFVRNTGFPGEDTNNARTCSVMLNRFANDICQIRLDFESMTTLPLGANAGSCGGVGDSLSVISPHSSSQNAFPPAICGALTGQHLYFESGRTGTTAGQINIVQGSGAAERRYNIKVSYIPCNSRVRAPSGCTQFFTEDTGTIMSYNFAGGQLLGDQIYGNCIRQNDGFCSVQYSETPITSPDPFQLDMMKLVVTVTPKFSTLFWPYICQDNCFERSHVTIPSRVIQTIRATVPAIPNTPGQPMMTPAAPQQEIITYVPSMRCDTIFGGLPGTSVPSSLTSEENVPFVLNLRTLPSSSGGLATFSGFSLDYTQVPC